MFPDGNYLIPDGKGHWKKTDPRIDRARVEAINTRHNRNVLNVIRVMKYWNKRTPSPSMGSYLLENIILDYYTIKISTASEYVDLEIVDVLNHISIAVYMTVYDPKGVQGDLNTLTADEKLKISNRASLDFERAKLARTYEVLENHEDSIKKWGEVFGSSFPSFG